MDSITPIVRNGHVGKIALSGIIYFNGGSQACVPCPLCGDLKQKTSKTCWKCYAKSGFKPPPFHERYATELRPGVIYKVTNSINGKIYVGKTTTGLEKRWKEHLHVANGGRQNISYFHKSLRKYGELNFALEILDHSTSEADLNVKEIAWITHFDSSNLEKGYNCTIGGEGRIHTEASRLRMKGRKQSPEHIAKVRLATIGRRRSLEICKRMSESRRGRKPSLETREKMSISHKKRLQDPILLQRLINRVRPVGRIG